MTPNLQRNDGAFPALEGGLALVDATFHGEGRSTGVQTLLPITAQPTITSPWTILGWSITLSMWLFPMAGPAPGGVLGKLFGGLILGGSVTPETNAAFQASSLPSDPTTINELWDGSTDATPPTGVGAAFPFLTPGPQNVLTVAGQLPVPLLMAPSDKLGMGLWLTPSLGLPYVTAGGGFYLGVEASYAIEYTTGT